MKNKNNQVYKKKYIDNGYTCPRCGSLLQVRTYDRLGVICVRDRYCYKCGYVKT